ncbi:serine/threonine protein kinase, CMGC group [Boothiomyces sp. JEL0838]|nr:serine/threonine protein kinase, CMGC group [Boothiomyces sp. JEL0838]
MSNKIQFKALNALKQKLMKNNTKREEDEYEDDEDDEEDPEDYKRGSYHLSRGHFSTVWLAKDEQKNIPVALKIVKSARNYTETALDEIKLLEKVASGVNDHVVLMYDSFKISGPNGKHIAMSFEVLGPNLLSMIKKYNHKGIPVPIVQRITKQILLGLDYLHVHCGIIHTDLKPENVLIQIDVDQTLKQQGIYELVYPMAKITIPEPNAEQPLSTTNSSEDIGSNMSVDGEKHVIEPEKELTANQKKKLKYKLKKQQKKEASVITEDIVESYEVPETVEKTDKPCSPVEPLGNEASELDDNIEKLETPATEGQEEVQNDDMEVESVSSDILDQMDAPQRPQLGHKTLSNMGLIYRPNEKPQTPPHVTRRLEYEEEKPAERPESPLKLVEEPYESVKVKIADLGNACWVTKHFTNDIQTRQYRSPEVILGIKYDTSTDIWSLGCIIFELLTGEFLFDPKSGSRYNKDDAQIIELVGQFPKSFSLSGKYSRELFNKKGELKHITSLRAWSLVEVLNEKYHFSKADSKEISDFILPLIKVVPAERLILLGLVYSACTVPDAFINDDYCDCPDGSDEPLTNACPNTKFTCKNIHHIPIEINSNRLFDSICDCCDGSDELPGVCPDTCPQIHEQYLAEQKQERDRKELGLKLKREMMATASKKFDEKIVSDKKKDIEIIHHKQERLQPHLDLVELFESEKQQYLDKKYHQSPEHEIKILKQEKSELERKLQDIKNDLEEREKTIVKLIEMVKSGNKEGVEDIEKEFVLEEETISEEEINIAEDEKEMEQESELPLDHKFDFTYLENKELCGDPLMSLSKCLSETANKLFSIAYDAVTLKTVMSWNGYGKIYDYFEYKLNSKFSLSNTDSVKEKNDNYEKEIADINKEIDEIQKTFNIDFGKDKEYMGLYDECISLKTPEYEYKLCFFKDAKQIQGTNEVSLGNFNRWDDGNMIYEGGLKCWNGPNRSVRVILECDLKTHILKVSEPEKCEYEMLVGTPAKCSHDEL